MNYVKHHPAITYFKDEYKSDWEYEYHKFLDERAASRRASMWNALKSLLAMFLPTNESDLEKRLQHCKTLAEVENTIKDDERNKMNQMSLQNKGLMMATY